MQLQQDYAQDPRFRLTPEFAKGDSPAKSGKSKSPEEAAQLSEKDMQMQILGEVVPSANRFKRDVRPVQIRRFDPTRPNPDLVIQSQPKKRLREEEEIQPEVQPKKKDKRKKTKEKRKAKSVKESEMRKKAPRKGVEAHVEVTAEVFKPKSERSEFKLFG